MSETPANILIVDDDDRLRNLLERYLKEQNYNVSTAPNAEAMDRKLQREHVDLIILDVMMPGEDGLSICRRLQALKKTPPILILSAKGDELDRIIGLEMGADDYLPKPFNTRELLARVKAILRRKPQSVPGAPTSEEEEITFGDVVVNLATRTMTKAAADVELSTGEFAVLKALVTHPRQTLSREQLMSLARGREYTAYDRTIDTQVSRLRKIIESDPARPRYLQTVWGVGYVFVPDGGKQ
jgi:two-component system phosphate regulon response regulator OmpR